MLRCKVAASGSVCQKQVQLTPYIWSCKSDEQLNVTRMLAARMVDLDLQDKCSDGSHTISQRANPSYLCISPIVPLLPTPLGHDTFSYGDVVIPRPSVPSV